jgi:hypothetical protein
MRIVDLHSRRISAKLRLHTPVLPKRYTLEEMFAALEASEFPPLEGFERTVRTGIINRQGQVTKLIGGSAEPELGAMRPTPTTNGAH